MRNKTFYEVVVETGSKRSENASINNKMDRYRASDAEFYKHIRNKLPRMRHSKIFPDTAIEMSSMDSENDSNVKSPTIFTRSFDISKSKDEVKALTPM